jgi:hypothetical protein
MEDLREYVVSPLGLSKNPCLEFGVPEPILRIVLPTQELLLPIKSIVRIVLVQMPWAFLRTELSSVDLEEVVCKGNMSKIKV